VSPEDCEHLDPALPQATLFAMTHWSVVLAAGKGILPRLLRIRVSLSIRSHGGN
jgi:hypothetical protein